MCSRTVGYLPDPGASLRQYPCGHTTVQPVHCTNTAWSSSENSCHGDVGRCVLVSQEGIEHWFKKKTLQETRHDQTCPLVRNWAILT